MKKLIPIIAIVIVISAFVSSCANSSKNESTLPQERRQTQDSIVKTIELAMKGRIVEDTVIGRWAIKTTIDSNNVVAGEDYCSIRDSSVFVTVTYDSKNVYSNKEIRTKDMMGSEGEYFIYRGGRVYWASDAAVYLSFVCAIPASDISWNMLYQILPDGTSNLIGAGGSLLEPIQYDILSHFFALYFNERAVGTSVSDMNRLFEHYCTEEIANGLSAGTIQIASDDTDFRYADQTTIINGLYPMPCDEDLEKYSFDVKFKPNEKEDNVADSLFIVVDGATDKISEISESGREMI